MKEKLLLTFLLTACLPIAAQQTSNKFVFTPQWTAHAQFAGYYVAKEKGFYKQAGIDVDIVHPSVSQTSMNTGTVIVSRRDKDPLTQRGARVGMWHAGFSQIPICMSIKEKLNYKWIRFTSNVDLFLKGAIDATLAMSYNEYYQLMQMGFTFTDNNVYRFCDHVYWYD